MRILICIMAFLFSLNSQAQKKSVDIKKDQSPHAFLAGKDSGYILKKDLINAGKIIVKHMDQELKVQGFNLILTQGLINKGYISYSEKLPEGFIQEIKKNSYENCKLRLFNIYAFT